VSATPSQAQEAAGTAPARHTLAVIGAGPIGLETAAVALDHGFDVHVFEQGEVGSNMLGWGHVRMFTPWRMNVGACGRRRLEATGWTLPDPERCPTGAEYVHGYLDPLAALPELAPRVHRFAQVAHVGRRRTLKGDPVAARGEQPFRLLVRDQGGRENLLHAFALIDATGVYGQPNWAGDGGIPARSELYLRPHMTYHLPDVLGGARARHAGRRTLVVGGGASGATTITALAELAGDVPGTTAVWVTRDSTQDVARARHDDPLPGRRALMERARAVVEGRDASVTHVGGAMVDALEFNSATHRYRVTLALDAGARVEEVDEVVVHTGFRPDNALYRELQVHECYASGGPMKLAAALLGSDAGDCLDVPAFGAEVLANPEPKFFILGHKSYGRGPNFLLETGFAQVNDVVGVLARALPAGVGG
jgi:cation diffusion facilitator CzcD-associated flavoprotein CzcO